MTTLTYSSEVTGFIPSDGEFTSTANYGTDSTLTWSGTLEPGATVAWNLYGSEQAPPTYLGYYLQGGTEYPVIGYSGGILVFGTTIPSGTTVSYTAASLAPCYLTGTQIETTRGPVAVEDLRIGDQIICHAGGSAPIRWIGHTNLDTARHPRPWDVNPVRVLAGAFGDGLPRRDLCLSPDHAVHVDGVLIPIRNLINDTTISQEPAGRITYWHVELDQHDIILAEGLPAESYLDTGNRSAFDNANPTALHADFTLRDRAAWHARACAELVEDGPRLAAIRATLAARAMALGLIPPPAYTVQISAAGLVTAEIPAGTTRIVLTSASRLPPGESRRLGAAIQSLTLDGAPLSLACESLAAGFHAIESDNHRSWRWTNGDAVLLLPPSNEPRLLALSVLLVVSQDLAQAA